jgi:hypothetical protein
MRNVFALTIVTGLALTGLANATQPAPNAVTVQKCLCLSADLLRPTSCSSQRMSDAYEQVEFNAALSQCLRTSSDNMRRRGRTTRIASARSLQRSCRNRA